MMQKLQDSVFSIVKTTSLAPAVFSFLQPTEEFTDKTPLGGILSDARLGWLALGPKFCVVDLKTGLKVAAHTFGAALGNLNTTVTCVVELPTPLTHNSKQLVISLEFEDVAGMVCIFHINGSQILRCIQTETVITDLAVCDGIPDGPFMCYDGAVIAGTKSGEILAFDLNRTGLIQALKDISNGDEHLVRGETNAATLTFLPLNEIQKIDHQRELAFENDDHIAAVLNEDSLMDNQYILRNPDSSVRMKADRDHIRVSALHYVPQLASVAVGFNFGAFQIWNLMTLDLEFTSQVNIECLPVTHFAFQEPCDDPRAFCYLWVVFSVIDRFEEEEFPLAVMYSLTYQGKRMLSSTKCLYQEFITATLRFQVELSTAENTHLVGGRCISCHSYSISTTLGEEGEDNMLNICHLVWECWGESANCSSQYGMLLFDLDQWYKDQMPATCRLESNAFVSATWCAEVGGAGRALHARLQPAALLPYSHATRLEEHFYPNSLQYDIICLNTSEACVVSTSGIQRQIIASLEAEGPPALLHPARLHAACCAAGLAPLYAHAHDDCDVAEQRRYLLSVALEARLSRFLWRCARDWAPGTHAPRGCTLAFLVDWCWQRALDLKENAKDLTAPLFVSSSLPDRNVIRCLENCVQQLTQLTALLDAVLTKCCNLLVPDALSEIEERHRAVGTVALYLQVVQWFLRVGLLPAALPYPGAQLTHLYRKRRLKLHRLQDTASSDVHMADRPCSLLYVDQLIEQEFGGEKITQMWLRSGSESNGLYPPPSLHSLLRLYLLPDIPEEHKHSLVLYLLLDYSMVYDEVVYEPVIRRLMQFPTMFGLSNTAIKATQAFWHLDHRDFDFAIDQLQCLTGNTLSEWQHNVVLSSLLAQKKHQAALQYLHVRKPAPVQSITKDKDGNSPTQTQISKRLNDQNKLEDWQSCCNLYLARQLVFEALDVIRLCVENASSLDDKVHVLNFFFKGCRNTGQLCKLLQITLQPLEEEVFVKYLQDCHEQQTSDILIMYYLQQARYLEAQQYNNRLKNTKVKNKDTAASTDTLLESAERESARDTLVEVVCAALPQITGRVASCALAERAADTHVFAPKPMSFFVQANSPKNKFTYKSSFIQATIENASETWAQRPRPRRGMKRPLCVEDTPFICTPKQRARGLLDQYTSEQIAACTPPKRARLDFGGTPRSASASATRVSARLGEQLARLLDVPEAQSEREPHGGDGSRAGTPHSILKSRREGVSRERDVTSPTQSHFSGDSDDDMLETASNHTHFSDSTNKHLRFTIPTASEASPSPSPDLEQTRSLGVAEESTLMDEKEMDISVESYVTSASHAMSDSHQLESPPKKLATEENVPSRKTYKDNVRARRILSISNSSLSDDPNTSVESIADIPVTLVNPRYSAERGRSSPRPRDAPAETRRAAAARERARRSDAPGSRPSASGLVERCMGDVESETGSVAATRQGVSARETERAVSVPRTPSVRRALRSSPPARRSRSLTPERADSPVASRVAKVAARTPPRSPSPRAALPAIAELPAQESLAEPHAHADTHSLSAPRLLRSRSRTPERTDKASATSPRLEAIAESTDSPPASPPASPLRRSLRSRSRTPEVEAAVVTAAFPAETEAIGQGSPRSLRSRSRTPEKLMSPKVDRASRNKKSLTRLVLEANTFAKTKQMPETNEIETQTDDADQRKPDSDEYTSENIIECTPMKSSKPTTDLMDVTFSPIVNKSVLQSSSDSVYKNESDIQLKPLPTFAMDETSMEKSVLHSCDSSADGPIINKPQIALKTKEDASVEMKSQPAAFKTFSETFEKSVLHSYTSSADASRCVHENISHQVTKRVTSERYGDNMSAISSLKDVSSLLTSDSDMEMKDDSNAATRERDVAIVIQKEKEKLVEIEREINEIEGEMSDSTARGGSGSSGDEEIIEAPGEESDEEISEEEISEEGSEESDTSTDENDVEVISLNDTESNESSSDTSALRIDEDSTELTDKADAGEARDTDNRPEIEEMVTETAIQEIDKGLNQTDDEKVSIIGASQRDDSTMLMDPLEQAALTMLTDDNSVLESDRSDVKLDYSDDNKESKASELKDNKEDSIAAVSEDKTVEVEVIVEEMPLVEESEEIIVQSNVIIERESPKTDVVDAAADVVAKPVVELQTEGSKDVEMKEPSDDQQQPQEPRTPSRVRTRRKSTSSNKSARDSQETIEPKPMEPIIEEQNAPVTRKRAGSVASNKSMTCDAEPKTPETQTGTPARRRAKTPTGTETRRILTRRASKELGESEKHDDSSTSMLDESANLTPKRRSARRKSADGASEGGGAAAPGGRKGRKTLLAPDLSVIPESGAEHANTDASEATHDLSAARRLTRYQRALLESPRAATRPATTPAPRRRLSAASGASGASEAWEEDASVSASSDRSRATAPDVQPIDRTSLLDKEHFEGSSDADESREQSTASPESMTSDASKQRRARLGRASSEVKVTPKAAKVVRRGVSVDIPVESAERGSPAPGADSPARGRRASFNRACEALQTPTKGRRTPTDVKDSPRASPAPQPPPDAPTPRRARRLSTQSNASATQSDTGRRSKKITPVVEEDKE